MYNITPPSRWFCLSLPFSFQASQSEVYAFYIMSSHLLGISPSYISLALIGLAGVSLALTSQISRFDCYFGLEVANIVYRL